MVSENNKRIIITLTKESLKILEEISKEECRTKSRQIEKMLRDYVKNKKKKKRTRNILVLFCTPVIFGCGLYIQLYPNLYCL